MRRFELAFSEFRGYETWQVINVSQNAHAAAVILGNPVLIAAYKAGFPANGKPVPDGAKFAKIHWQPKLNASVPQRRQVRAGLPHHREGPRLRLHGVPDPLIHPV